MEKTASRHIKIFYTEVWIKNILLFFVSLISYPIVEKSFSAVTDPALLSTLILFVGLIIILPLFACFAFTYETIKVGSRYQRYLGHFITFLIMYSTFVLLAMIDVLFVRVIGNVLIFRFLMVIFVLCIFLYDFWDANRVFRK